jgi:hypothetical protein
MSKNQRSMPKNVLATLTLAGMMLGAVVTPVMAAPGDFYDTTTKIHYSYPLSAAAKANIISVYAKGDSLISEKTGPKYLDYNSAYNLFSTQILAGATPDAAILAVANDSALYLNFDPTTTTNYGSVLQIIGTPVQHLVLGNLSVTVNDATKVAEVMVNGTQVSVTPLGNVYTVPISSATDYVVFVGTDGVDVVAQGTAQAAPALTASSKTYNSLLSFESVTVNNSALVANVSIGGVTYVMGAAAGADGIAASVVDATHIKVTGLTVAPATVILVPASGTSVTI